MARLGLLLLIATLAVMMVCLALTGWSPVGRNMLALAYQLMRS